MLMHEAQLLARADVQQSGENVRPLRAGAFCKVSTHFLDEKVISVFATAPVRPSV